MKEIILDFSEVNTLWNLHEYLKAAFSLPDYYGHNMDALWDCLHCSFDEPTRIVLRHLENLPADMKVATDTMQALFRSLEEENEEVTVITEHACTEERNDRACVCRCEREARNAIYAP